MTLPAQDSPTTSDAALQAELDALTARLESRASISWFARAFVSACLAFITGGIWMRLLVDVHRLRWPVWAVTPLAVGTLLAALYSVVRGVQERRSEARLFERLCALRDRLGVLR